MRARALFREVEVTVSVAHMFIDHGPYLFFFFEQGEREEYHLWTE